MIMTPEELYQKGIEAYNEDKPGSACFYFQQAAEQGHTGAEYWLGSCYDEGEGVREDKYKAMEWYRKAAEKGYMYAQHDLAELIEFELGGMTEAFGWYKKAADQGHTESALRVARLYKDGIGTERSYEKAMEYFNKVVNSKADAFDKQDSMEGIGWLYYYGQGVEKDECMALVWFKKSVEQFRHFPKKHEWYEQVESLVHNADIWESLKKYIDKNGNIIEKPI